MRAERDNATTEPSAHDPDLEQSDALGRGRAASELDELSQFEMDVLTYDMERALHWSRMRGQHLRRGGTVRWFPDGTFVLESGVAGIGQVVTRSGDT